AIMRTYNQKQLDNKHDQDRRVQEIYEQIPQIRQIEDAISSQALICGKRLLDGDLTARGNLKAQIEDLREQKALLLSSHGYAADYMEEHYRCADCKDTGYIGGSKCHCFKQEQIKLLYAQSNIDQAIQNENFAVFSYDFYDRTRSVPELGMTVADYMKQVYGWCKEFADNYSTKGGNLIFTGSTGVGKTFLTNCIAKELIDRYQSVIYLSANDLFDVFSKNKFSYEPEEEMRDLYQYILDCDLLIIDDLGTELNNTFVSSQLFYCINERLLRKKGTIISTNLSITMLRDTYSDRISSRIMSQYSIIPLYGDDIRTKKH
ncbi:MAG: ATP-binding protein, partial [Hungatella sp.]